MKRVEVCLSGILVFWIISNVFVIFELRKASQSQVRELKSNFDVLDFKTEKKTLKKKEKKNVEEIVFKDEYDVCIVGAGLSGTVFGDRYSREQGKSVLIIDERPHIGGNCFDYVDEETGILMNKYGAHLFHTDNERVFEYLTSHKDAPEWLRWDHKVVGWVKNRLVPIPVNIETVNVVLNLHLKNSTDMREWLDENQVKCVGKCNNAEEMAVSRVGQELYELIFKEYTVKQWDKEPRELDSLVTARIPVRDDFETRYFSDKYQLLPSKGYTKFFEGLLSRELIDVKVGLNYFEFKSKLDNICGKTIYTGPIDKYFQEKRVDLASLEYRSIEFVIEKYFNFDGFKQPNSVVNYPSKDFSFTRIVEYKHFLNQQSKHTITVKELSTAEGDPYYPVPNKRNLDLYEKYRRLAEVEEKENNIYFVGRLANYKYFNMDTAILNALEMFDRIEDLT